MSYTTDPNDPRLKKGYDLDKVPQNEVYLVLSEEERLRGFIRPLRDSYIHVGRLYDKGVEILDEPYISNDNTYVAIANIIVDENGKRIGGSYLTQDELNQYNRTNGYVGGCNVVTKMSHQIAETYARDPKFYGATYCVGCERHIDVNEFFWDGTNEVVGS